MDTLSFSAFDSEFIQILNCNNQHWVCVSTIGCKDGAINVYDSMLTGDVPIMTKEDIASMMTTRCACIYLIFPNVQQQKSGWDCGLYAIAFVYILEPLFIYV